MLNDLVTQSIPIQNAFLYGQAPKVSARSIRRETTPAEGDTDAAGPIRGVFGHRLIAIGEKLVGHAHPEPHFEHAA